MEYAVAAFPFGNVMLRWEEETVTELSLTKEPPTALTSFSSLVFSELTEYLNGQRKSFSFATRPDGTHFQKKVWDALLSIPYGETRTYREIAGQLGKPQASRAVGSACHRNPILFAIPCHRVIGSGGALTGYAGGLSLKKSLLEMEKAHIYTITR